MWVTSEAALLLVAKVMKSLKRLCTSVQAAVSIIKVPNQRDRNLLLQPAFASIASNVAWRPLSRSKANIYSLCELQSVSQEFRQSLTLPV